jgi:ABC-2 type transport system permease protein
MMLKTLLRLLGADYEQWRALTGVAIKLDLRTAGIGQTRREQSSGKGNIAKQIIARLLVYVFFGFMLGILVAANKDVFFTGTVLITYTMAMVSMLVLIDFGAIIISPDDFAILGYQPVSSSTYFITRLTNALIYSIALSLTLGFIPIIAFLFTLGFNPLLGLAALLAILLSGMTTTLALVFVYAGILRIIHPNKLRRVTSYIHLAMSFVIYGSYMILPRMIDAKRIGTITLAKPAGLFLIPSTWFASYLELARGSWRLTEIIPALVSISVFGLLLVKARSKLALDYADRLSSATAVSEGPKKISRSTARRSGLFKEGESRAVALLIRNQFKYDQKFRLAVLGILPMTVLYLFMGLQHGPLADPFVSRGERFGDTVLLYFAVLLFPSLLKATLATSDYYRASWIYYATPADQSRLVLASNYFIFAYFTFPYLVFFAVLFAYYFRNLFHVVVHLGTLAMLSYLLLQIGSFFNPVLPFSKPIRISHRSGKMITLMLIGPTAIIGILFVLSRWVYPNTALLAGVVAGLAALVYCMEAELKKRVRRLTAAMEYQE